MKPVLDSLNFICLAKSFFFPRRGFFVWDGNRFFLNDHLITHSESRAEGQCHHPKCAPTILTKWPGVFTACKCRDIYNFIYKPLLGTGVFFSHRQVSDLVLWVGRGSLASLFKTLNLARSLMGCVRRVVGRVLSGGLSAYGSFWCFILGYVSVMGLGQFYRYWVDRDG